MQEGRVAEEAGRGRGALHRRVFTWLVNPPERNFEDSFSADSLNDEVLDELISRAQEGDAPNIPFSETTSWETAGASANVVLRPRAAFPSQGLRLSY